MSDLTEREVAFRANVDRCTTTMHNHQIYLSNGDVYYSVYFHHCDIHFVSSADYIDFTSCVFHGCRFFRDGIEAANIIEAVGGIKIQIDDISKERCLNVGTSMYDPVTDRLKERGLSQ